MIREVINELKKYTVGKKNSQKTEISVLVLNRLIYALEEQEPWITVSEKVPEKSGEYLVSVIDGSGEDNDYEAVRVAWFAHKKDYDIKESEWRELGIDEAVIAWMPLPKPYKAESEE